MSRIGEIIEKLESVAPPALQESYDNSGLLTGNASWEVTNVLVSLDCTEEVIQEAIDKNCNLIVSHHPIWFTGLKKLTGSNYVERTILSSIKNDIALYAMHTNLDSVTGGVNSRIADKLGLNERRILDPKSKNLKKLVVYCPSEHSDNVRNAMFSAGAGYIGNYDHCSFNVEGFGTFRAGEGSQPFTGEVNKDHKEKEVRIESIVEDFILGNTIRAMLESHPYEEVAYDVYPLDNKNPNVGMGLLGSLPQEMALNDFLQFIKDVFQADGIRYSGPDGKKIKKVAVCGGSGSFLIPKAKSAGADIFVTSDIKYHQFFDSEDEIVLADIGHFESEQFTVEVIAEILNENFNTFATYFSSVNTNPIKYF